MFKKLKSKKGYIFTYEALAVAFIFIIVIYVANMAYIHNSQTFLDIKKDVDVAHKSILLKDYYIKKYSFPGSLYNSSTFVEKLGNNIKNKNIKTFDLCNNFSSDSGNLYFLVYSNNYDKTLYDEIPPSIRDGSGNITFQLYNKNSAITLYSNMADISNAYDFINLLAGDIVGSYKIYDETLYIPTITLGGDGDNIIEYKSYGSNGDITYFYIDKNNVNINLNIRALGNNENNLGMYTSWKYASPLTIVNNLNKKLNNYAVKYVFNSRDLITNEEMNEDCSDIRIIDNNGNELNYWIEPNTINTTNTVMWINTSLAPLEQKQIYMLYGNNLTTSVSNGENTFLFFDEFSNGVDNTKWNVGPNTNINNYNSVYDDNNIDYSYISLNNGLIRTINSYPVNTSVRSRIKYSNNINEYFGYKDTENIFVEHSDRISNNNFLYVISSPSSEEYSILPDLSNSWNTYEIQRNNNENVNLLINNTDIYQKFTSIPDDDLYITYNTENGGNITIDWVFVRNYVDSEPTIVGGHSLTFEINGQIYSTLISSDGGGDFSYLDNTIKNGINEIKVINSDVPVEFNIGQGPEKNFQTVTLSPRTVKMVVVG